MFFLVHAYHCKSMNAKLLQHRPHTLVSNACALAPDDAPRSSRLGRFVADSVHQFEPIFAT